MAQGLRERVYLDVAGAPVKASRGMEGMTFVSRAARNFTIFFPDVVAM